MARFQSPITSMVCKKDGGHGPGDADGVEEDAGDDGEEVEFRDVDEVLLRLGVGVEPGVAGGG